MAARPVTSTIEPSSSLLEARKSVDDWTSVQSRTERKKTQNRLNQRAYRRREAKKTPLEPSSTRKPNKVPVLRQHLCEFSSPIRIPLRSAKSRSRNASNLASPDTLVSRNINPAQQVALEGNSTDKSLASSHIGNCNETSPLVQRARPIAQQGQVATTASSRPDQRGARQYRGTSETNLFPLIDEFFLSTTATTNGSNREGSLTLRALNCRLYNKPVPRYVYWESTVRHPFGHDAGTPNIVTTLHKDSGFNDEATTEEYTFPIAADHMITLIHYNIYRAFKANKEILIAFLPPCPLYGTMQPISEEIIPSSLQPTELQQLVVHPCWVSIFPLPRLRDNAIVKLDDIAWDQLISDLVGGIFPAQVLGDDISKYQRAGDYDDFSHPAASSGNGIIVWGEAWDIASWEVTPAFIRRWGWLLVGCPEIIDASDRWRTLRGDLPLREVVELQI